MAVACGERERVQQMLRSTSRLESGVRSALSRFSAGPQAATLSCLTALICAFGVVLPAHGAGPDSHASSAPSVVLSSSQIAPPVIVVGFLGGFVRRDEPHHPEVHMIEALRQEYPQGTYFGLFENRRVNDAYKAILKRVRSNLDDKLSDDEKRRAHILLFGHSWGAAAVVELCRRLERLGIPVTLSVQIDSVAKPFQNDWLIPPNVLQAVNFYQTHGLIHGRRKIVPADPAQTTILGNFRWEYKGGPAACHGFSWRGRLLSKGHTEIECDREIWSQVESLLRAHLPNREVIQTNSGGPGPRSGNDGYDAQSQVSAQK